MKNLFLLIILLFSYQTTFSDYDTSTTIIKPSNTISETSKDLNKDKMKVNISDSLSVETWFWNSSSKWDWYVENIMTVLQILSLLVFSVGILWISIITVLIIFNTENLEKVKEYKEILKKIILWFFFYTFVAGAMYVWIINKWRDLSQDYYDKVLDENDLNNNKVKKPSLFRNN